MKNIFRIPFASAVILLFYLIFLSSCNTSEVLPSSSGKSGELIISIDSTLLKSSAGKRLYDTLSAEFPALPQYEPIFKIVDVQPTEFKSILQLHRNVLMVETGPLADGKNFSLTSKYNVWSKPQMVMNLRLTDSSYLDEAVATYSSTIKAKFIEAELFRMIDGYNDQIRLQISRDVKSAMHIDFPFTEDYFMAKSTSNYMWIRKETIHSSMGVQFYRFPYVNRESFSADYLVTLRDSLTRLNIPGPSNGSFMVTDKNYPPDFAQTEVDSAFAIQIRGLWRTEGDFMGGPFVSFLINDEKRGELLFVDGYVYAPKFNKREYVKQLEAMIYSLKLDQ